MNRMNRIIGMGLKPRDRDLIQASSNSYESEGKNISGYTILKKTPTLTFYKKNDDNTIIIAVRGTKLTDINDLFADASLLFNSLKHTTRYKNDKRVVEEIMNEYNNNDFYLSSHSLGSAVADQLLRDFPNINGGLALNAAFEFKAFSEKPRQRRIYNKHDFLGQVGRYLPEAERATTSKQDVINDESITDVFKKTIGDHAIENIPEEMIGSGFIHKIYGPF